MANKGTSGNMTTSSSNVGVDGERNTAWKTALCSTCQHSVLGLQAQMASARCPPVHAVVEQGVLEEAEAALNGKPLPHRCIVHLLDQAKQH